jgi:hypothetical protein
LARPLTVAEVDEPPAEAVIPPGDDVTVKLVMAEPPSLDGAVHVTVAWPLPAVAVPMVGALGAVGAAGVTELDAADGGPVPTTFVAVTVKV